MSCAKVGEDLYLCCGKEKCSNTSTSIWGSNPYTSDCPPCQGARHSGTIGPEGGFFKMVPLGQVDSFKGSEAHDITTADYGAYSGVRVEIAPSDPFGDGLITQCFSVGEFCYCRGSEKGCTGGSGSIWGSNPYTYDSPMCQCAIHAGLISREAGGFFKLEALSDNPEKYEGTTANDITSTEYGSYRGVKLSAMTDLSMLPGASVTQQKTFGQGEEVFTCVQCNQRYIEVENDILANACNFHEFLPSINPVDNTIKKKVAACCGQEAPCKKGPHRPIHHCDYRYAAHEKLIGDMTNGDCLDMYGEVKDDNLDKDSAEVGGLRRVAVAKVRRWKARTTAVEEDILMVHIGNYCDTYHIKFYTSAELDAIAQSGQTRIARLPDSQQSYSFAEWIIQDGALVGVHIEAKSISSADPDAMDVYFSRFPLELVRTEKLTDGGITLHTPETEYDLPESIRAGPLYPVGPSRPERSHTFHTHGQLPLRCAVNKIKCKNSIDKTTGPFLDVFNSQLLLVNTNKSDNLVIVKMSCEYRVIGQKEWTAVPEDRLTINQTCTLAPYTLHAVDFKIVLTVPPENSPPLALTHVLAGSLCARFQPIRFRFTLIDVEGRSSFRVFEYVTPRESLYRGTPSTDARMFVDDLDWLFRDNMPVTYDFHRDDEEKFRVNFGSSGTIDYRSFSCVKDFNEVAYTAMKTGEYEQHINTFRSGMGAPFPLLATASSYALIDENTHRVYAVKVILSNKTSSQVCYFKMPLYGNNNGVASKIVPIKPAVEKAVIPEIEPRELPVYEQDDDFDDIPYVKPVTASTASGKSLKLESSTVANLQRLNASLEHMADSMEQFESIEKSITSISDSIAALVDKLAS